MKFFCETHLRQLLAPSIAGDDGIEAFACACERQIKITQRAIPDLLLLARLAEDSGFNSPVAMLPPLMRLADCAGGLQPLSDELLDLLAWQLHVEGYDLAQDRQAKVQVIQESLYLHRKKGTPRSLRRALELLMQRDVQIPEWFTYGGDPYYFRVRFDVSMLGFFPEQWRPLLKAIYEGKLFAVDFNGGDAQGIYRLEKIYCQAEGRFLPEILASLTSEIRIIRDAEIAALQGEYESFSGQITDLESVKLAAVSQSLANLQAAFELFVGGEANGGDIDRLAELIAAIAQNRDSIDSLASLKANQADLTALAAQVAALPGTETPKAHGTAAAGASAKFAREDHVHPSNNTDTHWTSHLYAGASNGSTNAATANGGTYLIICDNTTVRDRRLIKGAGSVTVTSDASGNITITGTDTNTTYGDMTGASATANGTHGLVPAPVAGAANRYLRSDGTWQVPPDTNSDTHWTSHLYAGASNGNANATTTNGNTYLILCDNTTARNRIKLAGGGSVTVTSDAAGNITITGTDTNTTYAAATASAAGLMSAADKKKLDGIAAGAQVNPNMALYLALAGGTMTGRLTIQMAGNSLILKNPDDVRASATTAQRWTYMEYVDKNGARIGSLVHGHATSGLTNTYIETYGQNNAGASLGVQIDANGIASGYCPAPPVNDSSTKIATTSWAIPKAQNRGTPAGYETVSALTNSQTININSADCINLATSGAVTLTFTAGTATQRAIKVICLTASAATTLTVRNAVWANNGSAPVWGNAGKILVLLAHFVGGRVVLSVVDNTQ